MGQRLNLEFVQGEKVIGNAYYHWCAYSDSALYLAKQALARLIEIKDESYSARLRVAHALHATGAKMTPDEFEWLKADADTTPGDRLAYVVQYALYQSPANRNDGLIGFSSKSIEDTQKWAEGTVRIDIDTLTIQFGVIDFEEDVEYLKDVYDMDDEEVEGIPLYDGPLNLEEMNLEDVAHLEAAFEVAKTHDFSMFKTPANEYYAMIS